MPVFVFWSGYFAKYNSKKMIKKILLPYIIFHIIAFLFYNFFDPTKFTLITPYKNSLYVYLPHRMIIYFINYFELFKFNNHPTMTCFIYAILLTFVLSRDFVKKLFTKKC